ncbi:hypothetical protein Tco_1060915 [Tanacetum coccineum]
MSSRYELFNKDIIDLAQINICSGCGRGVAVLVEVAEASNSRTLPSFHYPHQDDMFENWRRELIILLISMNYLTKGAAIVNFELRRSKFSMSSRYELFNKDIIDLAQINICSGCGRGVAVLVEVAEASNSRTLPSFHYPHQDDMFERSSQPIPCRVEDSHVAANVVGPSVARPSTSVPCHLQQLHVASNVSPDRRSIGHSSFVPCEDQGVHVPILNVGVSVPPKRRCVRQSTSASSHDHQFSTPGIPHGIRNRRNYATGENSLRPQPRVSGPPLEYRHIGNCTHSCQHCGALFWYEERLRNTARGLRPRYNRCCKGGRVALRTYQVYPQYLKLLLEDRHFMDNIRAYNQMFSMTSVGAKVDESINNGRGPYVFKISGQLYHWIGSLCPSEGDPPRFLQLYIYDTDNEVDNRMNHFGGDNSELRRDIVEGLINLLDTHNALVQLFRTAREKLKDTHIPNFKVRLYNVIGAREYELPTGDMLGTIVYETGPGADMDYNIILERRSGYPQRVNKLHPSYMSLQFPLLFI